MIIRTLLVTAAVLATGLTTALPAAALSRQPTVRTACPVATTGQARCFAEMRVAGHSAQTTTPQGYGPADLAAAYRLPSTGGAGQTVAVVDAGGDATAAADLAVYRQQFGLPACTTANGCFREVNQAGQASPLPPDAGWGVEIALDLDMVSAACPDCHILLVEGNDPTIDSLAAAENTAAGLGATEISNSYGAPERNGLAPFTAAYAHPGVAITVSSGDFGYGVPNFPAALDSVIAVGGTSLTRANNARGWTETAWNSLGGAAASGCSAWFDKPSWQQDPNCPGRMVADVAADADPLTGPAVYGTTDGLTGWGVVGGTSAAAPYIAGVIGLAGNPARYPDASYFYAHAGDLNDVVGGNNTVFQGCGGDYQCNAVAGYDGPTGLGTPNGIAAF